MEADRLSIVVEENGAPSELRLKTSECSDGSTMVGRWSKVRRGRVEVRMDLHARGSRRAVATFDLEMN